MRFVCESCKAKYSISDEKVRGKILKIRCKKCKNIIEVRDPSTIAEQESPTVGARRPSWQAGASDLLTGVGTPPSSSGARGAPDDDEPGGLDEGPSEHTVISAPGLLEELRRTAADLAHQPTEEPALCDWYVAIDEEPTGPVTREQLRGFISTGRVTSESLVWREGYDDWRPLAESPELKDLLRASRPYSAVGAAPSPRKRQQPAAAERPRLEPIPAASPPPPEFKTTDALRGQRVGRLGGYGQGAASAPHAGRPTPTPAPRSVTGDHGASSRYSPPAPASAPRRTGQFAAPAQVPSPSYPAPPANPTPSYQAPVPAPSFQVPPPSPSYQVPPPSPSPSPSYQVPVAAPSFHAPTPVAAPSYPAAPAPAAFVPAPATPPVAPQALAWQPTPQPVPAPLVPLPPPANPAVPLYQPAQETPAPSFQVPAPPPAAPVSPVAQPLAPPSQVDVAEQKFLSPAPSVIFRADQPPPKPKASTAGERAAVPLTPLHEIPKPRRPLGLIFAGLAAIALGVGGALIAINISRGSGLDSDRTTADLGPTKAAVRIGNGPLVLPMGNSTPDDEPPTPPPAVDAGTEARDAGAVSRPTGTKVGRTPAVSSTNGENGKRLSDEERRLLEQAKSLGSEETVSLNQKKQGSGDSEAAARGQPLSDEQIRTTVTKNSASIRSCYEREMRGTSADLRVDLRLNVAPSGVVSSARVRTPQVQGTRLAECMERTAKRWSFPQATGSTTVDVPFFLTAAGSRR